MGLNKISKKDMEIAKKVLEQITINTNEFIKQKGHTFKNLNRYEEAIKCYNIALDLNPLDRFRNNGRLRDSLIECEKFSK